MMGSPMSIYDVIYPNRDKSLDRIVVRDLFADGLITIDSLNVTMSSSGIVEKRTTDLGDDFLYFYKIDTKL